MAGMYFWRLDKLKKELSEGTLSQRARFGYFAFFFASSYLQTLFPDFQPSEDWRPLVAILSALACITGLIFAYRANGGSGGRNLADRFLSLGLVIGIRCLLLLIPIIPLALFFYAMGYEILGDLSICVVVAYFWVALIADISEVHRNSSDEKETSG